MKKLFLLLIPFYTFILFSAQAQTTPSINVNTEKNTLTINGVDFSVKSTLDDYIRVLGKAERIEKIAGMDRIFAYDKLGISLNLNPNTNIVGGVSITYIFDGDKKVAKEAYQGKLSLNNTVIDSQTQYSVISGLAKLKYVEVMKGYYIGKGELLNLMIYYPEAGKTLGQFGIVFGEVK